MSEAFDKFSEHLKTSLTRALAFALDEESAFITPRHLLWAITTEPGSFAETVFVHAGIQREAVMKFMGGLPAVALKRHEPKDISPHLSQESHRAVEKALLTASMHGHQMIGTEHLLYGILSLKQPEINTFLEGHKVTHAFLERHLTAAFQKQTPAKIEAKPVEKCEHCGETHEADEAEEKTALEFFCVELTAPDRVKKADALVGRSIEIDRLSHILCRRTKNNPLLLGDPGVGKTAIVEGLAKRIVEETAPPALKGQKIYMLDMASIVAGAMYRGDFEARLLDVIDDLKEHKEAILFIDELHTIMGAGAGGGALDASNIFKPALARGEIRVIGATTREEYKKHIEQDGALARRFASINVGEPSAEETLVILKGLAGGYEKHHAVKYSPEALKAIIEITARYFPHKKFPDKAIDLLDEAGSAGKSSDTKVIDELFIAKVASRISGIPVERLNVHGAFELRTLGERLARRVVAQDDAVASVVGAITRARLGFTKPERPLVSFLFVGPSGVGKTALAKAVAEEVFGDTKSLIRLDMSEFAEPHTVSKLIGSPPGYVGYRDQALLTDAVKAKPHAVILFDEIEKAHREVHHLLLQILDEGTLTDATGAPVNFRNTIIIMTSNAGRERFERGAVGFTSEKTEKLDVRGILEDSFKTELLNRIDRVCLFRPLNEDHLMQIAKKELNELSLRLKNHGIALTSEARALPILAKAVNKKFGARDLHRVIEEQIEKPLAEKVLQNIGKSGEAGSGFAGKHRIYKVKVSKKGGVIVL